MDEKPFKALLGDLRIAITYLRYSEVGADWYAEDELVEILREVRHTVEAEKYKLTHKGKLS